MLIRAKEPRHAGRASKEGTRLYSPPPPPFPQRSAPSTPRQHRSDAAPASVASTPPRPRRFPEEAWGQQTDTTASDVTEASSEPPHHYRNERAAAGPRAGGARVASRAERREPGLRRRAERARLRDAAAEYDELYAAHPHPLAHGGVPSPLAPAADLRAPRSDNVAAMLVEAAALGITHPDAQWDYAKLATSGRGGGPGGGARAVLSPAAAYTSPSAAFAPPYAYAAKAAFGTPRSAFMSPEAAAAMYFDVGDHASATAARKQSARPRYDYAPRPRPRPQQRYASSYGSPAASSYGYSRRGRSGYERRGSSSASSYTSSSASYYRPSPARARGY